MKINSSGEKKKDDFSSEILGRIRRIRDGGFGGDFKGGFEEISRRGLVDLVMTRLDGNNTFGDASVV